MLESYITHIRIQEDAAYPQSPAPPDSDPKNKKQRVIVISVHKTKLVRIHKGRENANGSFSIGKTWEMYELSAIENYVHSNPQSPELQQHKSWAKDTGFLVTIVKPYYWEAHTAKEKEFFIGSMVKVYTKFTDRFDRKQGKYPILTGFADKELETLTDHRPWAATEEGRAAHDVWMAPYTNRDDVRPPSDDPGPYARWEKTRQPPGRAVPPSRPQNAPPIGDRRRMMPPEENQPNRNLSEDRDTRRPAPPVERDMRRPPPLSERRPPPPRGPPRPPTAEGETRQRRPGPLPMSDRADPAIFSASPGDNRMPPASPRFGAPSMGTPPPPGLQAGRGQRPSADSTLRNRPSRENMALRPSASRERLQPMPSSVPPIPIPTPQRLEPQPSRSELRPKTPDTIASASPIPSSISPGRSILADDAGSQRSQASLDRPSFDGSISKASPTEDRRPNANGYPLSNIRRDPSPRGLRPGISQGNVVTVIDRNEDPVAEDARQKSVPPERRRPPMENRPAPSLQINLDSQVGGSGPDLHAPVRTPPPMEPPPRRRPLEIPERFKPAPTIESPVPISENATLDRLRAESSPVHITPLAHPPPPPTSPLPQIPRASEPKERSPVAENIPEQTSVVEPILLLEASGKESAKETVNEPEVSMEVKPNSPTSEDDKKDTPTVNPMETKMGKAGAASAFRKLATAAGAFNKPGGFVPRAGGAFAKKMQQEDKKSDEPDGISAVFVPQRHAPKEELKEKTVEETPPRADRSSKDRLSIQTEVVPEVKVSAPLSPTPVTLKDEAAEIPEQIVPSDVDAEISVVKSQTETEVRRKRRRSNQQIKNISRLGIDPNMLDEQGLEFEILLSEFGWGSSDLSAKSIESLESDIRREIARVEAGSWLNHLEQKDDRVEAVEKLLDRAIAECDELEGLLTLYNVELSVSCSPCSS